MKPTLSASWLLSVSLVLMACFSANAAEPPGVRLSSGEFFINQSWSQEQDFSRSYHVSVPWDLIVRSGRFSSICTATVATPRIR